MPRPGQRGGAYDAGPEAFAHAFHTGRDPGDDEAATMPRNSSGELATQRLTAPQGPSPQQLPEGREKC